MMCKYSWYISEDVNIREDNLLNVCSVYLLDFFQMKQSDFENICWFLIFMQKKIWEKAKNWLCEKCHKFKINRDFLVKKIIRQLYKEYPRCAKFLSLYRLYSLWYKTSKSVAVRLGRAGLSRISIIWLKTNIYFS